MNKPTTFKLIIENKTNNRVRPVRMAQRESFDLAVYEKSMFSLDHENHSRVYKHKVID